MTEQTKADRLADELAVHAHHAMNGEAYNAAIDAAAELRRLHAENETLRQQHLAAHNNSAALMGALTQVSLLTDLGGEVAEYADVVEAVRRLSALNAELLEVAKLALRMGVYGGVSPSTVEDAARAAIAKVEGK
jgi:hypothetical protein